MPDLLRWMIAMAMVLSLGCDDDRQAATLTDAQPIDTTVTDTGGVDAGTEQDAEPSSDAGSVSDAAVVLDVGVVDARVFDAAVLVDAFVLPDGALDLGTNDAEPRAENPAPLDPSPPGGAQMSGEHLEGLAADGAYLHFPPTRMTPRVPELGDTSDFQPWFILRTGPDEPWVWLIMALYLPDGAAERIPNDPQRILVGRTGPWRTGAQRVEVPAGQVTETLMRADSAVCGHAKMFATFDLVLLDGQRVPNVLGLIQTVSPQARFSMDWLRGCNPAELR